MIISKKCPECCRTISLTKTEERGTNGAVVCVDGLGRRQLGKTCRDCLNVRIKKKYGGQIKGWAASYNKTEFGFLVRKYRNMLSRVSGVQWRKAHLYYGLPIIPKSEFYQWALSHPEFKKLFSEYVRSGYERKLCPTVDRIDQRFGYVLFNMRWLTHSENSRLTRKNNYLPQLTRNS